MAGAKIEVVGGMLFIATLRAWAPLLGRGLLWSLVLGVFAHLGGATWSLRHGPPPRARWGWSALATGAEAALALHHRAKAPPAASSKCKRPPRAVTDDGRIVLNLASARDLVRLPGVGTKRADAIVAVRKRLGGRFRSLRQLMRVRGIGPRSLKKLQPHLVLDAPPTNAPKAPPKRKRDK